MRKKIIFQLCLILLISLLTACGQKQEQSIIQERKTDQIDTTEVENSDFINEIKDTSINNDIEQDKQDSTPNNEKVQSQDKAIENQSSIDELDEAEGLPSSIEEPENQLFEDCDEVVYATDTVNIRVNYSADSENLGILDGGQSITRTGTGINDADGWSRVQLSDGSTVYISSKYLSTEKPAPQQSQQAAAQQQPKTQQPKAQQPKAQQPKAQQPKAPAQQSKAPSSTPSTSGGSNQSLDSLLSGLVDEDGFSIGHTDKNKDWSGYVSSEGYHSTGEQDVESWSHIQ